EREAILRAQRARMGGPRRGAAKHARRGAAKRARRATARMHAGACDTFCEPPRRVTMAAKERQARGTYPVCFAFFHSCRRASERGSCGYPKLFLLLRFLSAARRRRRPRPRSSRCRRALFCPRIAASTRLDGVPAASFGAGAATVSAAAIPMVPAQAARREV